MTALITRVRSLIADPSGAGEVFSDDTIQEALDITRLNVRYAQLRPAPSITGAGVITYTDYWADIGDWEADVTLWNGAFTEVTPATADLVTGHWTFDVAAPGQVPPLFILGKSYDAYAASADLLDRWSAMLAGDYDFSGAGQSFRRSQAFQAKSDLAARYRRLARVHSIPMIRNDLGDDTSVANILVGATDLMGY